MRIAIHTLTLLATLFVGIATNISASPLSFTDNTFDLTNYTFSDLYKLPTGVTVGVTQCGACGVGGSQGLDVTASLPGADPFFIAVGLVSKLWTVDTSLTGPVASIDATVEKNLSVTGRDVPADVIGGNTFRPLVYQNGTYFLAAIAGPSIFLPEGGTSATTGYNTLARTGLTPADFLSFDFTTGAFGLANPDFAQTFSLGLGQLSVAYGFSEPQVIAQYDNLSYDVNPVPEPATLLLMATGLAVGARTLKRTRKNRDTPAA